MKQPAPNDWKLIEQQAAAQVERLARMRASGCVADDQSVICLCPVCHATPLARMLQMQARHQWALAMYGIQEEIASVPRTA